MALFGKGAGNSFSHEKGFPAILNAFHHNYCEDVALNSCLPKPAVLAITRDTAFLRGLRLEMPLLNMKKQGLIEDYFITNPSLFDVPDDLAFDVIWLQRVNDPRLIDHLSRKIDNHYLYDLDDLLIGTASYRGIDLPNKESVLEAAKNCRVLAVTSARLGKILQKYTPVPIENKIVVCANAFEFGGQVRRPSQPNGIILTSSEELPLMDSGPAILKAVADFSESKSLPIYYFGPRNDETASVFRRTINFGVVSYWHYHALLQSFPPMIGIAPLETEADEQTLDFVNGKSDVKMVDFGGFGHPSVYSNAPPFVDTDLKAGIIVENTYDAWSEGLTVIHRELWNRLDKDQRLVMELRNMDRIAAECWSLAVGGARLPEPMTGKEIKFSGGRVSYYINATKHMIFSQDHLFRKRLSERIPKPLLSILRKYLLNT